jgi:hypothetical protein
MDGNIHQGVTSRESFSASRDDVRFEAARDDSRFEV